MALSRLHVRWESKWYERSRWMIVVALLGLAIQYVIQMEFGFLIAGCSRHHRAGPARRTGHLGQSARVTGSLPTRKAALPSTHHGARTEPLFLFPPLRGSPKWAAYMACNNDSIWNYRHLCIFIVVRVVFLAEICYICMKV